jgi:hypothetical protein
MGVGDGVQSFDIETLGSIGTCTLDVDPDNLFQTSSMLMKLFNLSHWLNISVEQSRADLQLGIVVLYTCGMVPAILV